MLQQLCRHHRFLQFRSLATTSYASSSKVPIRQIDKILIANRGEIAIRVMRTAKRMGIRTVAVYSEADKNSMHAALADEAYCIGPAASADSYLRSDRILETAAKANAQAIHPGYGFLSENATFADACLEANRIFIGPPSQAIRDMGLKSKSKQIMEAANVPVVKGYHGDEQSDDRLRQECDRIGYPVMLKAVYGGGGKGMRIAYTKEDFQESLDSARREAKKSFGNDEMIAEKYVERPRHVEVQVFGDQHGNYVYLYERDCSVQRRHQKIIEEAPAPGISEATRKYLGEAAVRAAQAVGYYGAGTVEFIMDPKEDIYFMEMNTRLQVEHPVSEMITGTDLVEWQLRVAMGEPLPIVNQADIPLIGHSFECRVYAEDPKNGFMPQAGTLHHLKFPNPSDSIRVETGVAMGDEVSVHYDPMIAKLVVHADDRSAAIRQMKNVLSATNIVGMPTNIDFMRTILNHEDFVNGNVYTGFIDDRQEALLSKTMKTLPSDVTCAAVVAESIFKSASTMDNSSCMADPFSHVDNFRINQDHQVKAELDYDGKPVNVTISHKRDGTMHIRSQCGKLDEHVEPRVEFTEEGALKMELTISSSSRHKSTIVVVGDTLTVFTDDATYAFDRRVPKWMESVKSSSAQLGGAHAPMPGVIEKVNVAPGDQVKAGDALVVMVAMKMEYVIRAPADGVVSRVNCALGDNVAKNAVLVQMEGDEGEVDEKARA